MRSRPTQMHTIDISACVCFSLTRWFDEVQRVQFSGNLGVAIYIYLSFHYIKIKDMFLKRIGLGTKALAGTSTQSNMMQISRLEHVLIEEE